MRQLGQGEWIIVLECNSWVMTVLRGVELSELAALVRRTAPDRDEQ